MKNINLYGFIILYGSLFLIILFKIFEVPITHDEVPTTIFYSRFSVWEIMMYPDNIPNNHILNTLLTKCCILLFGKEQWAVRLTNLLSFILFSWGVFRILKSNLKRESFYFLPSALLFVNPYLLDFFGLSRGYGLSTAILIFSMSYLISGFSLQKKKHIWIAFFSAILASYANFTLLIFWFSVSVFVLYYFLKSGNSLRGKIKPVLTTGLISLLYLALIYTPLKKIQSTNEFQFWTSRGFYDETIGSLVNNWRYNSAFLNYFKTLPVTSFVILVSIISVTLVLLVKRKAAFSHPAIIAVFLLVLNIFINLFQTNALNIPNLNGRTALFFYPMISAILVGALGLIKTENIGIMKIIPLALTVFFLFNLFHRLELRSVKEWEFDQNNAEVIAYLKDAEGGKQVSLRTHWLYNPSFTFYSETGKTPWIQLHPYNKDININCDADYYYAFTDDLKVLEEKYEVIAKFGSNRILLKRK